MSGVAFPFVVNDGPAARPLRMAQEMIEAGKAGKGPGLIPGSGLGEFYGSVVMGSVMAQGCSEMTSLMLNQMRDQITGAVALSRAIGNSQSLREAAELSMAHVRMNMASLATDAIRCAHLASRMALSVSRPFSGSVVKEGELAA